MIGNYKRFKNGGVLHVTKELLGNVDIFSKSDRIWRAIRVDINLPSSELLLIPRRILQNVEFASFVSEHIKGSLAMSNISLILGSTPKISTLQLDIKVFERNMAVVFNDHDVRNNLKQLKRLEIVNGKNGTGNSSHTYKLHSSNYLDILVAENVNLFTKILHGLESFCLTKMKAELIQSIVFRAEVMDLIKHNRETLQELSVHLDVWENKAIAGYKMPRLTSLTATTRRKGQETLERFVANHPSLEALDIAATNKLNGILFNGIRERSANLKKLHLKAKNIDVPGIERGDGIMEVDWSFLERMTRLKDFQLSRPQCKDPKWEVYGNGSSILQMLPRHQLERLGFRGIGDKMYDFWKFSRFFTNGLVISGERELRYKLDLFRGFVNLKRLSFNRCPDAVDDDIMRFIVSEMTSLEEFEVSHCSKLTDAGIAGKSEDGSDSIRNLKGQ